MTTLDTSSPTSTTNATLTDPWRRLLRASAAFVAVTAVLMQASGRFVGPSFVVLAVTCLIGYTLPPRRRQAAAWTIGVVNMSSLLLHGPMMLMAFQQPQALLAAVLGVVNGVSSVLGVVAAIAVLRGRPTRSHAPSRLAIVGLALCGLFTLVSVATYATRDSVVPATDEQVLVHEGLSVTPKNIEVDASTPTLVVRNDDPVYARSFDVDALDMHVLVPPRTAVRVTLPAEPATYHFYDFLTFTAGTEGTIQVR